MSSSSMYSTRSQTRAAYLVGICSNLATTGLSDPGGTPQTGLSGNPA